MPLSRIALLIGLLALLCSRLASAEGHEEPLRLRMRDLQDARYCGRSVEIRGFLYKNETGEKILAAQPNLRTCCVGSEAQRNNQIAVRGHLETPENGYSVTLRGLLASEEGKVPHYSLENAVIVKDKEQQARTRKLLPVFLGSAGLLAALVFLSRLKLLK